MLNNIFLLGTQSRAAKNRIRSADRRCCSGVDRHPLPFGGGSSGRSIILTTCSTAAAATADCGRRGRRSNRFSFDGHRQTVHPDATDFASGCDRCETVAQSPAAYHQRDVRLLQSHPTDVRRAETTAVDVLELATG